ncbi:hypothetical protein [Legionella sainthelensi]|uniref:Uncharacterized protein n=1 Tax=Legionella sainthelensi TaxID=28087 RepID=A0A2H5FKW4_9GAMM|nr:hypothetical protein [Legionella sainthelensi]AUH72173.1 hypothetical protein CAB17_08930 [Legionella sainthelensi]
MKFGLKDLINATLICNSVTDTLPITPTNLPTYKATIQYAEHILNNLEQEIAIGKIDEGRVSKLKNAIRQLKSDLYLYLKSEIKNAPQVKTDLEEFFRNEYLTSYVKEHAEEIIKTEQEIQKSALSTLGIFTKFDQNDINPEITDIKATFK